jgi:hypothetical protein
VSKKPVGKKAEPTTDELEFIYQHIKRLSDQEILEEMQGTAFPVRSLGFIKRRRREFNAARKVLEIQMQQEIEPITTKSKREHYEHLAEIASALLSNGLDTVTKNAPSVSAFPYTLWSGQSGIAIPGELLSSYLQQNMDQLNLDYNDFDLHNFMCHLEAEYPEIHSKGFSTFVRDNPYELIQTLKILAQRRVFEGKCPVCNGWQY